MRLLKRLSALTLVLALLAACTAEPAEQPLVSSWTGFNTCQPSLTAQGNLALCGLYVRARDHQTPIEADVRLQMLTDGAWRTLKIWYGLTGEGELNFAENFWLQQPGEYRLHATLYAEGETLQTTTGVRLAEIPPRDTSAAGSGFRKVFLENFLLYQAASNDRDGYKVYRLPDSDRVPGEELLATAEFAGSLGYNGVGGLKIAAAGGVGSARLQIPAASTAAFAEAMQQGRIFRLALGVPLGELWFLQAADLADFAGKELQLSISRSSAEAYHIAGVSGRTAFRLHFAADGVQVNEFPAQVLVRLPLTKAQRAAGDDLVVLRDVNGEMVPVADAAADWYKDVAEDETAYVNILTSEPGLFVIGCREEDEPAPAGDFTRRELLNELYAMRAENGAASAADEEAAVAWALERGIFTGTAAGDLLLDEAMTRQDAALLLYRFVKLEAQTRLPQLYKAPRYTDRRSIRPYAREAVNELVRAGVISNDSERFRPYDRLSAAEGRQLLDSLRRHLVLAKKDYLLWPED